MVSSQAIEAMIADAWTEAKKRTEPKSLEWDNLTAYKKMMYKRYQHAPHLEALDNALMEVTQYVESGGEEGIGRIVIEMPPRHGKTLTVSRLYPTWHLGRNPDHRVMLVSYGASLAHKNSRYARAFMMAPRYQDTFEITLDPLSRAAEAWDIANQEGGCDAMGIGGAATGKGAHVLIIDDPIKNREEAESETIRNKIWDSFTDDLLTRLEPGGAVIIMMTRWQQDDLIGRILKLMGDVFERLRMPAMAEEGDPLGRRIGDALWPWRYPLKALRALKKALGPYSWASLFQQNPVPAEGGTFKRIWFDNLLQTEPPIAHAVRFWDLAMSEKTSADYTVGLKLEQGDDGHYYITDIVRRQIDWGDLTEWLAEIIMQDGPDIPQGIEMAGYMSRAVETLNADSRLHNYEIYGYPVHTDKFTRALPFAAKCAAGLVHVLDRHWTRDYLDELCSFNKGAHDDQVDASSGAWEMIGDSELVGYGDLAHADNPRAIG